MEGADEFWLALSPRMSWMGDFGWEGLTVFTGSESSAGGTGSPPPCERGLEPSACDMGPVMPT